MVKYCTNCGTPTKDIANFCQNCGDKFINSNNDQVLSNNYFKNDNDFNSIYTKLINNLEDFNNLNKEYGLIWDYVHENEIDQLNFIPNHKDEKLHYIKVRNYWAEKDVIEEYSPLIYKNLINSINYYEDLLDIYQRDELTSIQKNNVISLFNELKVINKSLISHQNNLYQYISALEKSSMPLDFIRGIVKDLILVYEQMIKNYHHISKLISNLILEYEKIFISI